MNSGNKQAEFYSQSEAMLVDGWGKTLVVAPHPDDESLGCGGAIALLRQAGVPVEVVFTSDGSMSHPASKEYPTQRLVALREAEALAALLILGVNKEAVHFMRLKDSQVPAKDTAGFTDAVEDFLQLLKATQPNIILVPWRRDPHKDHQATAQIVDAAIGKYHTPIRRLEYLIWLWERGEADEFPRSGEARLWRINIKSVTGLKQQAIATHVSQTTRLIHDDSEGFILSPEVLAHFAGNEEFFVEMGDTDHPNFIA